MNARETIYAALFAKISAAPGFVTMSRRLKHWTDVPPSQQPALYQSQRKELAEQADGRPVRWIFELDLLVYVNVSTDKLPSTALNTQVDAVLATLVPDNQMTGKCTLGGVVTHAWVEGTIETDEGTLGNQAVAIIPIRIRAV